MDIIKIIQEKNKSIEQAVKRLKGIIDWSDRIGSDEIHEIRAIIALLKGIDNKKVINTKQVIDLIESEVEYLETSEGNEYPCITVENLEGVLNRYFDNN